MLGRQLHIHFCQIMPLCPNIFSIAMLRNYCVWRPRYLNLNIPYAILAFFGRYYYEKATKCHVCHLPYNTLPIAQHFFKSDLDWIDMEKTVAWISLSYLLLIYEFIRNSPSPTVDELIKSVIVLEMGPIEEYFYWVFFRF